MHQPKPQPKPRTRVLARLSLVALIGLVPLAACTGSDAGEADAGEPALAEGVTVFQGARLIAGDGSAPIEDAVIVVQNDRFVQAGPSAEVEIPEGAATVDLAGKTVMPAIVNAHLHFSNDRDELVSQLQHTAYYGVGTVQSLGLDSSQVTLDMRQELVPNGARYLTAGRGITAPEPGRSEVPHWVTTPEEAQAAVQELASNGIELVKIWVDDRGGQYEKLSPELYGAVIDEAHQNGMKVAAHIFSLEDAKGLLMAGIDAFAHSVRDMEIDEEMVTLLQERPEFVLIPNLGGRGVATDLSWLSGTIPAARLEEMQANSTDRPEAKASHAIQAANLVSFNEAGVTIAFGTDGGNPWAAHEEIEDMVLAGMTPADAIVAATRNSAQLLGLEDVGTITPGMSADFVVLDANPLDDITNTRLIFAVYLRGEEVDREGISTRLLAATAAD